MKERILVPLDGSALAELALPHAVALARATSRALTLVRVVPPLPSLSHLAWAVPAPDAVWDDWAQEPERVRDYLEHVVVAIVALGLEVHTECLNGDPAEAIVEYAERHPWVTTIAMSTHGQGGLGRLIFGSVAEKVVRTTPVPVLVVRAVEGDKQEKALNLEGVHYSTILVPLDGSPFAEQALEWARPVAQASGAKVVLISAVPDDPVFADMLSSFEVQSVWDREFEWRMDYVGELKNRIVREGIEAEGHVMYRTPAEAIMQMADAQRADLIVMSTHGRGGLHRLWMGSVADEVVRHATQPVLLVRAKARVEQEAPQLEEAGLLAG